VPYQRFLSRASIYSRYTPFNRSSNVVLASNRVHGRQSRIQARCVSDWVSEELQYETLDEHARKVLLETTQEAAAGLDAPLGSPRRMFMTVRRADHQLQTFLANSIVRPPQSAVLMTVTNPDLLPHVVYADEPMAAQGLAQLTNVDPVLVVAFSLDNNID